MIKQALAQHVTDAIVDEEFFRAVWDPSINEPMDAIFFHPRNMVCSCNFFDLTLTISSRAWIILQDTVRQSSSRHT